MTELTGCSPAERHRAAAADFTAIIDRVTDWDAQSPVAEWTARDVVNHLVEWLPGFLRQHGIELGSTSVTDSPAADFAALAEAVQALLDAPDADRLITSNMFGEIPLSGMIDQFYTSDIYMHSWDLARSNGIDPQLDPAFAAQLYTGMQPMAKVIRESGQFGDQQPVADDADDVAKLIAFIGRDPEWSR